MTRNLLVWAASLFKLYLHAASTEAAMVSADTSSELQGNVSVFPRYPEGMAKRRQRVISSGVLWPVLQGRQVVGREKPSLRVMHASRGAGQLRSEAAPSLLLLRYGEELETAQSNFNRASTLFARFLTRLR